MKKFSSLEVTALEDGYNWRLDKPFYYISGDISVVVPKDFTTDFASIPRAVWHIVGAPATGKHRYAAVVHDWLYATELYDRKRCDDIFLQAMKDSDVAYWRRNAMYYAVRWFGWRVWQKHTTLSVVKNRALGGIDG